MLIELTNSRTGKRFWLNPDKIIGAERLDDCTKITTSGQIYEVVETPQAINDKAIVIYRKLQA